jgi:hypothetical protein
MAAEAKRGLDEMARLKCPTAALVQRHDVPEEAERISRIKGAKMVTTFKAASLW